MAHTGPNMYTPTHQISHLLEQTKHAPPINPDDKITIDLTSRKRKAPLQISARKLVKPDAPTDHSETHTPHTDTRWARAQAALSKQGKPNSHTMGAIYNNLSTQDDQIGTITAYRTAQGEDQYLVTWLPKQAQQWEINLLTHPTMGYKTESTNVITDHTITLTHTCEYCEEHSHPADTPLERCTMCHRTYHIACLPRHASKPSQQMDVSPPVWTCPDCHKYRTLSRPRKGQPSREQARAKNLHETRLMQVQYAPSWEPAELVMQYPNLVNQANEIKLATQQPKPAKRSRDADQPDTVRQGLCPLDKPRYNTTLGSPNRHKLVIHPAPIHPNLDIHPTGQYEIQFDEHLTKPTRERHAYIYGPEGQFLNTIKMDVCLRLLEH